MSKIPFTLDAWLKDKSRRVETRDGRIVHNIWPVKELLIFNGKRAEVCALIDGEEDALVFFEGGKYLPVTPESPFDLFIVTPEEEMTPFEKGFLERVFHQKAEDLDEQNKEIFLEDARYVLALAREQFIKDGYVIEKKAFHDAVKNISDKHRAEMSVEYSIHCKIEDGTRHAIMDWDTFQKVTQKFIDIGKAEALKDLPRWNEWGNGAAGNSDGNPIALVSGAGGIRFASVLGITGEKYIMLDDLKKLPGFKED